MADEQELLEEGWQARDLRSGVAKVFQEAKARCILGIRVSAVWAVVMFVYASVDMAGIASVAPPAWEIFAALAMMLLAALSMSRTPPPMLMASVLILVDLVVVAFRFPELFDHGQTIDFALTAVRITLAPVALSMVINGYFGALSIQAFKLGFSPGADWRTRINPAMLQLVVIGSCVGALVIGVGVWFGAIGAGFAQTNVIWHNVDPMISNIEVRTARPEVEEAKTRGKEPEPFLNIKVLKPGENDGDEEAKVPVYPEAAKPVTSVEGWDAFGQREIEDAFDFGKDSDEAGCFAEGQGRQGRCRDERCRHWSRVFVRACLTRAKKTPKYCDEVPAPTAEEPGMVWAQRLCAGREFEMCREILYAVQGHCHPPEKVAAQVAAEPPAKAAPKVAEKK